MRIYHVGLNKDVITRYRLLYPHARIHALISYGRRDTQSAELLLIYRDQLNGLVLDSGTYSLYNNPKKYERRITLQGYQTYLKNFAEKFDFYFNFDSDFSEDGFDTNFENQLTLEMAGFRPVPVVHNCNNHEIPTYIDRGHDLIALGSSELKYASLDDLSFIVDRICRQGVKVHFLGSSEFDKLAYLPVFSCDSSTRWQAAPRGHIFWWNPHRAHYKKIDKVTMIDDVPKRYMSHHINDYEFEEELDEYLESDLGLTIEDVSGPSNRANRDLANLHYFVKLEEIINQKHQEQGFRY